MFGFIRELLVGFEKEYISARNIEAQNVMLQDISVMGARGIDAEIIIPAQGIHSGYILYFNKGILCDIQPLVIR